MCLPNILFPVFMFAFIFHCRSFSPCWPLAFLIFSPPLWISMFFFLRNSSPLFSITRSSSFSVIHVSVNIKNNAEKDTTLLLFFLSKSKGYHVISFQKKPWVAFGLPYLLIDLFYIGMPVVQTDGHSLTRSVYGHVITKFWGMGRLPHIFLSYGAPPTRCASHRAWSSAMITLSLQVSGLEKKSCPAVSGEQIFWIIIHFWETTHPKPTSTLTSTSMGER